MNSRRVLAQAPQGAGTKIHFKSKGFFLTSHFETKGGGGGCNNVRCVCQGARVIRPRAVGGLLKHRRLAHWHAPVDISVVLHRVAPVQKGPAHVEIVVAGPVALLSPVAHFVVEEMEVKILRGVTLVGFLQRCQVVLLAFLRVGVDAVECAPVPHCGFALQHLVPLAQFLFGAQQIAV